MRRVRKRATRPLLQTPDPVGTMQRLLSEREPIYAQADLTVYSREASHETVVEDVLSALETHVNGRGASSKMKRSDRIDIGVELPGRRYDIIIGDNLLAESGALIAKIAPGAACAVITDTNVARHHLPRSRQVSMRPASGTRTLPSRREKHPKAFPITSASAITCSPRVWSAATSSSRSAAVSSAISPVLPRRRCAAACGLCRFRQPCWRRSTRPSAAKPASIRRMARISSARFISLRW